MAFSLLIFLGFYAAKFLEFAARVWLKRCADRTETKADDMLLVLAHGPVKVVATEFATALAAQSRGDFEASAIGWSGRADPDGNLYNNIHSKGALNETRYSNANGDAWLDEARATTDFAARKALYAKVIAQHAADLPVMYLDANAWIVVTSAKLSGFRAVPDGLIRIQGMRLGQ